MYVVFLVLNWLPKLEFLCRKKLVQVTRIGETRTGGGGWGNSSNAERMHFSPEENVLKDKFILWFRLKLTLLTFKLHSRSLYSCGLFLRLPDNIFSGKDGGVSFQFATDVGGGFFSSVPAGQSIVLFRTISVQMSQPILTLSQSWIFFLEA